MGNHRGTPARQYSWPPFEKGNTAALKHGAGSPRVFEPIAAELMTTALDARPYLRDSAYTSAVWAWARAEAKIVLLERYLDERGLFDADGKPYPALDMLLRYEASAARLRGQLGLTPLSQSRLGRNVAAAGVNLADLMSRASDGDPKAIEAMRAIGDAMGAGVPSAVDIGEGGPAFDRDDEDGRSGDVMGAVG